MPGSHVGKIPIIRMYGLTEHGNSVMMLIHGVIPYFFVEAPPGFKESDCESFRRQLNVYIFFLKYLYFLNYFLILLFL